MNIELKEITVRELTNGYEDNEEGGVIGYDGKLDIRPPYQREFIYKEKQRDAVIDTITKDFPLNVMYWAVREDGNFEVIDGQQRTISICQFVEGDFAFNNRYFHNLQKDEKEQILNYKLMVYFCTGSEDSEKLKWFETINIAGEKLTDQELKNAVFSGSWVLSPGRTANGVHLLATVSVFCCCHLLLLPPSAAAKSVGRAVIISKSPAGWSGTCQLTILDVGKFDFGQPGQGLTAAAQNMTTASTAAVNW